MFGHIVELIFLVIFSLGNVIIQSNVTFTEDSDLNGASPQFILTCISTGGPATTVTWTRDSAVLNANVSVYSKLNNIGIQYTHTLTVTGRLGGLYTCTVANDKPSQDSAQLNVQGILIIWCKCTKIIKISPQLPPLPLV